MTSNFSSIDDRYTQEFQHHNPDIISLNVGCVDLNSVVNYRGGEETENDDILFILESLNLGINRLASGRINNNTLDRVRKMGGGWHITPFYGLADRAQINYFRFKPNNPPADWKKPGKFKKYLGAEGESPRAYCPNVTEGIWATIAARYGVEKTGIDFWEWILDHPEIPVIITEGEKKAFAGLAAGFVVISLPGIDSGYKSSSDKDDGLGGKLALIPDLKALAEGRRTVLIAFDRDSNPQTVKRVQKARKELARLFGESGCQTLSIKWDDQYKGLDDFIFGAGQEALSSAIENAYDMTPKPRKEGETKDKNPSALEMSKKVFKDLFENTIRFDASVKQYWRYDGKGKWVVCSDEHIFGVVQEYLEEAIDTFSPNYVENVIRFGKKDILYEGWTEMSSLLYLPFENGVLEMATKQLLPHSPDYGFTWQLPRLYSAIEANWGNIDGFLDSLCVENQQLKELAIAYCNAVLVGRSDLHKFLYLFGSGRNGKGVFSHLLTMLIGKENTHSTTMIELNGNRFEPANLRGKRLVLMSDEDKYTGGIGILKSASGGDPLRHEDKGKKAGSFYFKGMIVISANSPTFVGSGGFALFARKIDFPCLAKIAEKDRRDISPELELDLTAFTTYLLSLSDDWVEATLRGYGSVEAVRKLNWEMTVREDSIAAFFSDKLIVDPDGSIACGQLYKGYQSYCEDSGLKPKSIKNFTPSLLELCNDSLSHSIAKKRTSSGETLRGLRLRADWEFEEDVSPTTDEKCPPLLLNNSDLLPELDNPTHPTLLAQSNGSNPTCRVHQPYTPYTNLEKVTPKIGDRVKSERFGKVGTVKRTRIEKTPKGTEFTRYLVDFGFDEHWLEAVALTVEVDLWA
jgi:putative DNA primase/helicase